MNSVKVRIEGLNLGRLITRLVDCGMLVNDLKVKSNFVTFSIFENDLNSLKKICNLERKQFKVLSKYGVSRCVEKVKRLFGFCLAVIIVSLYLFSFNCFVFKINIVGVDGEKAYRIEKLLNEYSIKCGMLKSELNINEIEQLIIKNNSFIKGCSIKFKGSSLNVLLFESANQNNNVNTEIISKYDAVVTKVKVDSGESSIKVGDVVRVGDVLIKSETSAHGEIFGKVSFVSTRIYNENQVKQVRTGNILEEKIFSFCNKNIVKPQNINYFSKYIVEKCDFYILGNFLLPLKCEIVKYVEIENMDILVPFKNNEEQIKNELYDEAILNVFDKDSVINVSYSVTNEGLLYRVDCYVECEINLAK